MKASKRKVASKPTLPEPRFAESYLHRAGEVLRKISPTEIEAVTQRLLDAYHRGAHVFLAGNGGSAALASHFACDLSKTVLGSNCTTAGKRFRVTSLSDAIPILTAWANDVSYDQIFAQPLRALANEGDLLLCISASGNSPNILEAVRVAKEMRMNSVALLGFKGGKARDMVDDSILVPVLDYGLSEAAHDVIAHLITTWLTNAIKGEEAAPLRVVA